MHDEFGIGLIHRGAQRSRSGRGVVEAAAGDTITVNPGEIHDGSPLGGERAWTMLYFEPWVIADAVADIGEGKFAGYEFERPNLSDPRIARSFLRLLAEATGEQGPDDTGCQEALISLVGALVGRSPGPAPATAPAPPWIRRVRDRIDDDPSSPLALAHLAREAGVSRFQLLRAFRKEVGLTPHAYLLQRRVHLARRLIACGTTLADAAAAAGFADQSHMTRRFVRNYGMPPGAYAAAAG